MLVVALVVCLVPAVVVDSLVLGIGLCVFAVDIASASVNVVVGGVVAVAVTHIVAVVLSVLPILSMVTLLLLLLLLWLLSWVTVAIFCR